MRKQHVLLLLCVWALAAVDGHGKSARDTQDYEIFDLGRYELQSGYTLPNTFIAYKTFGTLSGARDNAIMFPTFYGATHTSNERWIGTNMALDPEKYFIIIPNMFGNGLSSSPSNTRPPFNAARFPSVTYYDNVRAQHRLLTQVFNITSLELVLGFSMGAGQTYHWAAMYPQIVKRALPFMGSAKTSPHNYVFLEGVKAALTADAAFMEGFYDTPPMKGLRAMGRVWAGWGVSQTWYRQMTWETIGYASVEDYIVGNWEAGFIESDANDLLCHIDTWQKGDISANAIYDGDFILALESITANTILMPCTTDMYFPPEDNEIESMYIPMSRFVPLDSVWGHGAGGGPTSFEETFINENIRELLSSPRR